MILITKNKEVFILDLLTRLTLDRWSYLTGKAPFQSQKPFQPSFWSSSFKSTLTLLIHMRSSFYAFQKMSHNLLMHYYWFLFIKGVIHKPCGQGRGRRVSDKTTFFKLEGGWIIKKINMVFKKNMFIHNLIYDCGSSKTIL